MKEFVEKLIEKLNEITEPIRPVGWSRKIEAVETKAVIQIIKELQEEYKANLSESLTSSNNGWIPCSERLPDIGVDVNITTRSSIVGVGSFFGKTNGWVQWYCGGGIVVDVIAWQPLPKPYRE